MAVKQLLKQSLTTVFSEDVICFRRSQTEKIILSFDDGPHPEFTPKVLDILKRHNVKAQFFLVGTQVQKHPDIVRRMVQEGHRIGSHSFSHKGFGSLPWPEQKQEVLKGVEAVKEFDSQAPRLFRPPQGRFNWKQILLCRKDKIQMVMWTVDSLDYDRSKTKEDLLRRLKSQRWNGGEIVLFHDDNSVTVDVLADFIVWARAQHREFGV